MTTQTMTQFEVLENEMLSNIEGGGCSWGNFAYEVINGGVSGALKTRTWQGAAIGATGYGILYGATCWW